MEACEGDVLCSELALDCVLSADSGGRGPPRLLSYEMEHLLVS